MAYIGRQQDGFGVRSRFIYTATSGQTTFDTDDSSNALSYSDGAYVDVYLNGVLLDPSDYTATSLTSIVLDLGASADDVLEVIVYDVFSVFSGTFTNGITASEATVTGDLTVDTNTLYVDSTNNRVGIGTTSPDHPLRVSGGGFGTIAKFSADDGANNPRLLIYGSSDGMHLQRTSGSGAANLMFEVGGAEGGGTEAMRLDSSGNLLIGSDSGDAFNDDSILRIQRTGGRVFQQFKCDADQNVQILFGDVDDDVECSIQYHASDKDLRFTTGNNNERMRIDSSGNLLVGKTTTAFGTAGFRAIYNGQVQSTVSNNEPLGLNRLSTDGEIAKFYKDSTLVGSINSRGGEFIAIGYSDTYLEFNAGSNQINPSSGTAARDNAIDLGSSGARFDDIYATNGTIQTSDQNEKQQIASLTDAEITAAKAISKLFKTFKWNDSVTANGDNARTHAGVIAQDVQSAMTDAGLDAGDYAFFISTTWWETQTDVPAIEAVAEVLDDDGNIVTEAVEAKEAYTRTDTYDTAEEAPEGATERTRLGIRYPELLAFVGAATEQRLADIETRLTTLENA